jgi:hypothetical protein
MSYPGGSANAPQPPMDRLFRQGWSLAQLETISDYTVNEPGGARPAAALASPGSPMPVPYLPGVLPGMKIFSNKGEVMSETPLKYADLSEADIQAARDRAAADRLLVEKREKQRLATKKSRENSKAAKEKALAEEPIETVWEMHGKALKQSNPSLHAQLEEKHLEVRATEAEVLEICEGVKKNLRAETRTWETRDSTEIFPMPDVAFKDIRSMETLNFSAIEGMTHESHAEGEKGAPCFRPTPQEKFSGKLDDAVGAYRFFGFRTKISPDCRRDAQDNLILHWLRTGDPNINIDVVKQAISDWKRNGGWHSNAAEIARLLKQRHQDFPAFGLLDEQPPAPAMFVKKRKS